MATQGLKDRTVLITGASRRVGRGLALASAAAGANVIVHYRAAQDLAEETRAEIRAMGREAWIVQADLSTSDGLPDLVRRAEAISPLYALVNNAAVFAGGSFRETTLEDWQTHLAVNLTAPFLLTQAFSRVLGERRHGRVLNLLDWRAFRPGLDHFAYGISKAGLASLTRSLALSLAPNISVNGLALGAILPPAGQEADPEIQRRIPARRWGTIQEVGHAMVFLLAGPAYVTGEIIHLDGGRHLV